jgi:hypothetical protein
VSDDFFARPEATVPDGHGHLDVAAIVQLDVELLVSP